MLYPTTSWIFGKEEVELPEFAEEVFRHLEKYDKYQYQSHSVFEMYTKTTAMLWELQNKKSICEALTDGRGMKLVCRLKIEHNGEVFDYDVDFVREEKKFSRELNESFTNWIKAELELSDWLDSILRPLRHFEWKLQTQPIYFTKKFLRV